jgi:NAD(P)-dependent dehydrogenase (short-subunit alcohol dehydrogenase family)
MRGWMDIGVEGTEPAASTTFARDIRRCPARRHGVEVLILGATGGVGRLIVRDAVAKIHSVAALLLIHKRERLDATSRSLGAASCPARRWWRSSLYLSRLCREPEADAAHTWRN